MGANNPFSAVQDPDAEIEPDGSDIDDKGNLGDAAAAALEGFDDGAAQQDPLDGTDYLKVKFVGMSMDSLEEEIPLGKELVFTVRARCTGNGNEMSKQDGHIKRFVKMDVQSVQIKE